MRSFVVGLLYLASASNLTAPDASSYNPADAKDAWQLTNAAYCSTNDITSWGCPNCKRSNYALTELVVPSAGGSACFAGYDKSRNKIILSFRGSQNIQNWINNINTVKTTYPYCSGCNVHSGFYKAYLNIVANVRSAVKNLKTAHPTAALRIYGHSLGGAEAVHAAADIQVNLGITAEFVYTFGQPRVGDDNFWSWYGTIIKNHFRVTHGHDIVPHLPPMSFGFHHTNLEEFYAADPPSYKECDNSGEDPTCSNQYSVSLSIKDHLTYMGGTCCCTTDDQTMNEPKGPVEIEPLPVMENPINNSICSVATTCDRCIAVTLAGLPACTWCTYQVACHAVGSIYNPCPNDGCVTRSPVSTCKLRNCTSVEAA